MKKSLIKNRKSQKEYLDILRRVDADKNAFFGNREPDGWHELETKVRAFIGDLMTKIRPADYCYLEEETDYFCDFILTQKQSSVEKNAKLRKKLSMEELEKGGVLEKTLITFSDYGQLVTIEGENFLDERGREMVEMILEKYGFIWIPNEVMLLTYDGINKDYQPESETFKEYPELKPTWLYRFFHV